MKRLIYTAVFGGYDRVYPPVCRDADADYVIVTDDPSTSVAGWKTLVVDGSGFATAKAANLYYRALIHRVLTGYDVSLYVDGNVRLIGDTRPLFSEFNASGAAIAAYAHRERSTVAEEVEAVIALGKIQDPAVGRREVSDYVAYGFPDSVGLLNTGVMLKNHRHRKLDDAMELWWRQFSAYLTRDQLSLPYVMWRTGIPVQILGRGEGGSDLMFARYPHLSDKTQPAWLNHMTARSHESFARLTAFRVCRRLNTLRGRAAGALGRVCTGGRS